MLRMTLVNQLLHATGISPVTPSQSLINLFLHIAISYCVLLHIHFKLFVPNHELRYPACSLPLNGRSYPAGHRGNPLYWNRIYINKNNHFCWLCCNQTTTAATPAQTLMLTWALMSASAPIRLRLLAACAPVDHVHQARHPPSMRLQYPLSQKVASTR